MKAATRKRSTRKAASKTDNPILSAISSWAIGKPREANYTTLMQSYRGWVHHCALFNANALAAVPLRLYLQSKQSARPYSVPSERAKRNIQGKAWTARKAAQANGEYVEVLDHPALDLLDNPNPYMTGLEFRTIIQLHLGLTGNAYLWQELGPLGIPVALWPVPPHCVWLEDAPGQVVSGYIYRNRGVTFAMPVDQIIHMRRPNPIDPYGYGTGPTVAEWDIVELSGMIDEYERWTLANNARPDGVLQAEELLTEDQVKDVREEWARIYGGTRNANRIAILGGGLKFQPTTFSPKDVSHLNGEHKVMTRIAAAFGIPMSMLTVEDMPLANAEVGERQYARRTLLPQLRNDEEILTERWVVKYDPRLFWCYDNPVSEDRKLDADIDAIYLQASVVTPNEVRARLNMPPLEGGDETAAARASAQAEAFAASVGGGNETDEPPTKPGADEGDSSKAAKCCAHTHVKGMTRREKAWEAAMRAAFTRQRKSLDDFLKAGVPDDPESFVDKFKLRLEQLRPDWMKWVIEESETQFLADVREGGSVALDKLGRLGVETEVRLDVTNPRTAEFIRQYQGKFVSKINATTRQAFRDTLSAGLDAGESKYQLQNRITDVFVTADEKRAGLIAQTESARAQIEGARELYREAGITKWVWSVSEDPCETCQELDGKVVEIDGNFAEMGDTVAGMEVDYEAIGGPPAHPACLLPGTEVSPGQRIAAAYKAVYVGPAVEFIFASGRRLSVTANHQLLMPDGFVAAAELNKGDYLLQAIGGDRIASAGPDDAQIPSRIEDVFASLVMASRVPVARVPVSAEDFHGDAMGFDGDIDVVTPDGLLWNARIAEDGKRSRQFNLCAALSADEFAALGNFDAMLIRLSLAAHGIVGRFRQELAFGRRRGGHSDKHGLAAVALSDAVAVEDHHDCASAEPEALGQLLDRYAGFVEPTKIVAVKRFWYAGHVYDLQTLSGLYIGNGVLSSNCRCDTIPIIEQANDNE